LAKLPFPETRSRERLPYRGRPGTTSNSKYEKLRSKNFTTEDAGDAEDKEEGKKE
jgi:hypothetical protein